MTRAIHLGPLQDTFDAAVHEAAVRYVRSDAFYPQWVALNRQSHEAAVRALLHPDAGTATVNLLPLVSSILAQVEASAPVLFGLGITIPRIEATTDPTKARAELSDALHVDLPAGFGEVTLLQADRVAVAGRAVRALDGLLVPLLVFVLASIAGALLASVARWWTALELAAGVVVVGVAALVAASRVPARLAGAVHVPWKGTADAIASAEVSGLEALLWIVVGIGAALALGSLTAILWPRLGARARGLRRGAAPPA